MKKRIELSPPQAAHGQDQQDQDHEPLLGGGDPGKVDQRKGDGEQTAAPQEKDTLFHLKIPFSPSRGRRPGRRPAGLEGAARE